MFGVFYGKDSHGLVAMKMDVGGKKNFVH